jgi:RimK-like ATP-grasp domain
MILLWGLPGDRPLTAVCDALRQLGCSVVFLDQRDVLHTEVELHVGSTVEGMLRIRDRAINLGTISAVYLRPYDSRRLPNIVSAGQDSQAWCHALSVEDILMSWAELTSALVVNRPTAMATNNSKPYQATSIQLLGFEIPDTLITTDPGAVLEFWKRHGTVIYKSVSGIRSIVTRLSPEHLERLQNVVWCPTQFQQYIPGTDYRVHVVGKEVFACKIVSEADDYRYTTQCDATITIQACDLPEDVANQCRTLTASLNLIVVGIDLRCTLDGRWYCFEVNPSPGFTYFQEATQQPIDEAIAKLLASGDTSPYESGHT